VYLILPILSSYSLSTYPFVPSVLLSSISFEEKIAVCITKHNLKEAGAYTPTDLRNEVAVARCVSLMAIIAVAATSREGEAGPIEGIWPFLLNYTF